MSLRFFLGHMLRANLFVLFWYWFNKTVHLKEAGFEFENRHSLSYILIVGARPSPSLGCIFWKMASTFVLASDVKRRRPVHLVFQMRYRGNSSMWPKQFRTFAFSSLLYKISFSRDSRDWDLALLKSIEILLLTPGNARTPLQETNRNFPCLV